jgi:hypothetical protein
MMMAAGCKRIDDQVDVAGTELNPLVLPLVMGPDEVLVGHVYMWDDEVELYVKYLLDVELPPGVEVRLAQVQLDVRMDSTEFPYTNTATPTIIPSLFQYQQDVTQWPYQEWTIPNIGGWATGSKIVATTHVVFLTNWYDPEWGKISGWAKDPNHPFMYGLPDCHGWWFPYKLEVPHDGEWHMNTAWGGKAYPNWKDWQFPGKNWALYIRYNLADEEYVGSLYAGNPKNDAAEKVVGTVTVSDDVVAGVGNVYVTYTITKEDRALFSGHTIVRGKLTDIPQKNGNPIPGQFDKEGFFGPFDPPEDEVTVTVPYDPKWGTNLYIGAHAEVGWYY